LILYPIARTRYWDNSKSCLYWRDRRR